MTATKFSDIQIGEYFWTDNFCGIKIADGNYSDFNAMSFQSFYFYKFNDEDMVLHYGG